MGTSVISWKCIAFNVIKEKKRKLMINYLSIHLEMQKKIRASEILSKSREKKINNEQKLLKRNIG